jgi:hypothetical protein
VYSGACIDYHYTVQGKIYDTSSTDTGEFTLPSVWWGIAGIPERYKTEQAIAVYYRTENPRDSRLEREVPLRDWITIGIGTAMTTLSAITLIMVLGDRTRRRDPRHAR